MKKEKRYYQIRMDYFWLSILAVIIVISIIIAYYASAHEQTSSQPVSTKHRADIDVTFDDLRSSLENTSECYLCGNAEESLMSYFRNFDTIGLISLNDWYVIDFPLKNYDENGNEVESATSTSFLSGNTGEISYSSDETPSRGMASIDVTLPVNYKVDTNTLEKHLCQNCLNKVAASLEYRKCIFRKNCASVPEERSAIPLQTEQSSAGLLITVVYSTIPARKFKTICLGCHSA